MVKDDVEFRFGDELTSIQQQENNVEVSFTSGKKEAFDLVVGADGVHSKTRELVFGKGFEKDLDKAYFAFIVPDRTKTSIARERELIGIKGDGFWIAYDIQPTEESEIGGYIFREAKPKAECASSEIQRIARAQPPVLVLPWRWQEPMY